MKSFGQPDTAQDPGRTPTDPEQQGKERKRLPPQPPLQQHHRRGLSRQQCKGEPGPVGPFLHVGAGVEAEPGLKAVNPSNPGKLNAGDEQTQGQHQCRQPPFSPQEGDQQGRHPG